MNPDELLALVQVKMPYGKYKDTLLCNLPTHYLEWIARENAWPKGKLGSQLHTLYEIKINGLEELLTPLKQLPKKGK